MNDIRYILFTGSMQPKNPMVATEDKIKEIVTAGFRQGKDFDIVSEKVLKDKLGRRGGGMMNINDMIRPIGMAAGGDANRAELEGLLKSLNISLMLAQETGSFLGGGNAEKIKELENQIRQIELELLK